MLNVIEYFGHLFILSCHFSPNQWQQVSVLIPMICPKGWMILSAYFTDLPICWLEYLYHIQIWVTLFYSFLFLGIIFFQFSFLCTWDICVCVRYSTHMFVVCMHVCTHACGVPRLTVSYFVSLSVLSYWERVCHWVHSLRVGYLGWAESSRDPLFSDVPASELQTFVPMPGSHTGIRGPNSGPDAM